MAAWSNEEDERLRVLWRSNTQIEKIANHLGRTPGQIYSHARRMKLKPRRAAQWSPHETAQIRNTLDDVVLGLCKELGRTPGAVRNRMMRVLTGKEE